MTVQQALNRLLQHYGCGDTLAECGKVEETEMQLLPQVVEAEINKRNFKGDDIRGSS
jgi:hypothetical protein